MVEDSREIHEDFGLDIKIVVDNKATHDYAGRQKLRFDPINNEEDRAFLLSYGKGVYPFREEDLNDPTNEYNVTGETITRDRLGNKQSHGGEIRIYRGTDRREATHEKIHALEDAGFIDAPAEGFSEKRTWELTDKVAGGTPIDSLLNKKGRAAKESKNERQRMVSERAQKKSGPAGEETERVRKGGVRAAPKGRERKYAVAAKGHRVTAPSESYDRGVENKGNVWVRQSESESNKDRQLMTDDKVH